MLKLTDLILGAAASCLMTGGIILGGIYPCGVAAAQTAPAGTEVTAAQITNMRSDLQQEINRARATGADVAEAERNEKKGDELLAQGDARQAQVLFEQARAALPHSDLRTSVGGRSADPTGGAGAESKNPNVGATDPSGNRGP